MPDKIPTKIENPMNNNTVGAFFQMVVSNGLPVTYVKAIRNTSARTSANTIATVLIITDSPRNWNTSLFRDVPIVLRIPTSFARRDARAVVRLMKLIPASTRINKEIAEKM